MGFSLAEAQIRMGRCGEAVSATVALYSQLS